MIDGKIEELDASSVKRNSSPMKSWFVKNAKGMANWHLLEPLRLGLVVLLLQQNHIIRMTRIEIRYTSSNSKFTDIVLYDRATNIENYAFQSPYLKGREPHGEIHLPREAQQKGTEGAGQPETRDLGLLTRDKEGRKRKTLQPQEKRSCLEG